MTALSSDRVETVVQQLVAALEGVEVEANATELAFALQLIATSAAEKVSEPRALARCVIGLAEQLMARAAGAAGKPPPIINLAHDVMAGAVAALRNRGASDQEAMELMLGFMMAWVAKSSPREAAALLYRHADALAGQAAGVH